MRCRQGKLTRSLRSQLGNTRSLGMIRGSEEYDGIETR